MTDSTGADSGRASPAERPPVLACYADAVGAIARQASLDLDWSAPTPCGAWTACDLAGHLVAVVRYYLRLLDAAANGAPETNLPRGARLAAMNGEDLTALPERGGVQRLAAFVDLARRHHARLRDMSWEDPLGVWEGLGVLTVGEHTGVAVGEWHVHAWDLARAAGSDHRPTDPVVVASGQSVLRRPVGPGDPWEAVLVAYGRDPDWRPWARRRAPGLRPGPPAGSGR